jgi:hypothetical protein
VLRPTVLRAGRSLRVRVGCGAVACDVRAALISHTDPIPHDPGDRLWSVGSVTAAAGRATTLRLVPFQRARHPAVRTARRAISLVACTPEGVVLSRTTIRPRLRQVPPRPVPRFVSVRAVRSAHAVRVSWRIASPSPGIQFAAWAISVEGVESSIAASGHAGRTRYSALLRVTDPARVRSVRLSAIAQDNARIRSTTVQVR